MELLAALVRERRGAVRRPARYAIAFAEGERFLLSTGSDHEVLTRGFTRDTDVTILTDERTMSDLLNGAFDPSAPAAHHLFIWGGDDDAFAALGNILGGTQSLLGVRAGASR